MRQFRLRTMFIAIAVLSVGMCYAGAYYRLSRRGLKEVAPYGLRGFFYVPADEVMASRDFTAQLWCCAFFAPANWVDRHLFGGPQPITSFSYFSED
jgi:hypothetical protein